MKTLISICLSLCFMTCSFAFTTFKEHGKVKIKLEKASFEVKMINHLQILFVADCNSFAENEQLVFELSPALMDYASYYIDKQKVFYVYNDSKYHSMYRKTKKRLIDKNLLSDCKGFTKHYIRV